MGRRFRFGLGDRHAFAGGGGLGGSGFRLFNRTRPIARRPRPGALPDVAEASNGDTLALTGSGTLTTHPKTVTGGGTFTHNFAGGGSLSGTWEATQLISFNGYGCEDLGASSDAAGRRSSKSS
ncbi:MAG: hypothetical protein ACR2NT_03130 [Acidimicrobiia bacterium]